MNKGNSYTAKAYFTDGSTQVIDVKKEGATSSWSTSVNVDDLNTWYTYTKNSSDVYTLSTVDNDDFTDKAEVNSVNALLATGVRANSSTVFIFLNDKGDVTSTVTGIRNVDFENADGYIVVKDGAAKAVVVTDYKGAKTAGDYIYILASTPATTNYDRTNDVPYYTYDAIVNGEKTTINSLKPTMTVGLYDAEYEYNGQYLSDTLSVITNNTGIEDEVVFIGGVGNTGYSDGTLTLTTTNAFVLADNYSLLTVDGKTVTSRTPARLVNLTAADGDFAGAPAIVLLNEDGEATCVIVTAPAGNVSVGATPTTVASESALKNTAIYAAYEEAAKTDAENYQWFLDVVNSGYVSYDMTVSVSGTTITITGTPDALAPTTHVPGLYGADNTAGNLTYYVSNSGNTGNPATPDSNRDGSNHTQFALIPLVTDGQVKMLLVGDKDTTINNYSVSGTPYTVDVSDIDW